jgi:hypothetical protein
MKSVRIMLACGAALAGLAVASTASAKTEQPSDQMFNFIAPGTDTCPEVAWNVLRQKNPDGTYNIAGMLWWTNGAGAGSITGLGQANGDFSGTVTKVSAGGPSGTFTGHRSPDGTRTITFKSTPGGCLNGTVTVPPGVNEAKP